MPGLARRVLTAGIVLPPVLLAVWAGPRVLALLLAFVAIWGAREMVRLHRANGFAQPAWLPAAGAVLLIASYGRVVPVPLAPALFAVTVLAMLVELARTGGSMRSGLPLAIASAVYLGLLPAHLLRLYDLGGGVRGGPGPVFYALALVWGCDTAAYGIGSIAGRHRLWPRVSPSKSWEGAVAGLAASVALALLLGRWVPGLSVPGRLGAGALAGIFAQVGDLGESLMKREASMKDSGGFFPGHGGVLDRIDSLLLAVPVLYYWLRWSLREP